MSENGNSGNTGNITSFIGFFAAISLGFSLLFMIPGLLIAGSHPENAKETSAVGYLLLILCWILNLIQSKLEKKS